MILFHLLFILFDELRQGSAGRQRRTGVDGIKPRIPVRPANLPTVHRRRTGLPFFPRLNLLHVVSKSCEIRRGLGLLIFGVLAARARGDTAVEHEGYYACAAI